ncbi:starch synthase (maltosyl-transferring) [Noviherbaspirillum humi]|uniref:Alpha-1,4-glucan:maltose-1-phosphate maltosyltransferase n=1 Tax=Noviherbaspirillum humi TaxID=1688639 RepID=A0A239FBG3_9BURK|nr:alpha-1,4-glucan--maltose-1-phosphate maltosyltransferase [Noviherbaspirillum humi]SNS54157.1 starch synthase (maltosyl-transferring) [Noviherbaspirillum humi]
MATISFNPRIYYLRPQLFSSAEAIGQHLDRCKAMGFDHVLVPTPHEDVTGPSPGITDATLGDLARRCGERGLKLLADLDMASIGEDAAFLQSHLRWFNADNIYEPPDPRQPLSLRPVPALRFDEPEVVEQVSDYWGERLQGWVNAGVAGFRCLSVCGPPPASWRRLIGKLKAMNPDLAFLAWTPGCTPAHIEALAGCGFHATFSSAAWWDYRSPWLADEQQRLNRVAAPIAFPDSPDESVIARVIGYDDPEGRRRIHARALRLAAAIGSGILVPMGFEYGLSTSFAAMGLGEVPFDELARHASFDMSPEIAEANAMAERTAGLYRGGLLQQFSSTGASIAALLRHPAPESGRAGEALMILANADTQHACSVNESQLLQRTEGFVRQQPLWPAAEQMGHHAFELEPSELQMFEARRLAPIVIPPLRRGNAIAGAVKAPRVAIEAITPSVDGGQFPVKRTIGDTVNVEADVFVDGHDKLAVCLLWRAADESGWREVRMHPIGNDRWCAPLPLARIGRHFFTVEAWRDTFATYRDELEKKTNAGLNVALEVEEGRLMVEAAAAHAREKGLDAAAGLEEVCQLLKGRAEDSARIAALLSEPTLMLMRQADARPFAVRRDPPLRIDVERTAARFSSWYELFPRSQSGDPSRHGTFDDVIQRLPAIQAMGFDTLYFPPIHPIGRKHRKGRNNSLDAGPNDPGSPYAIGSEEGGHDAIHPQLGTLADFRRLRDEAARHGLELALDFAIQCSPDHPWLKDHPDWFAWRPDGTIRYAENPPKKYQDIVNVDFYARGAIPDLWIALRDVVLLWAKEGVRVFRVDNPHTKPLPFWEWMIAEVRARYPDTIFLSEAFTRPKMMYRLAKVGYSQSYTYFTWRHTKQEFIEYLTELTTTNVREYFRPHFFVNTPDINPYFLQQCGRPGYLIRAALATLLSGLWGMYSGFELCEGAAVPGKEEYLDSEKYEIRAWDWQRPGNIIEEITQLNRIRRDNPALQTHLGVRFLHCSSDRILYFMKATEPVDSCHRMGDNVVLGGINLDPFHAHEGAIEVPLWEFGLPDDGALEVEDLVGGGRSIWHGKFRQLRLDPFVSPYAIWRVRHKGA